MMDGIRMYIDTNQRVLVKQCQELAAAGKANGLNR